MIQFSYKRTLCSVLVLLAAMSAYCIPAKKSWRNVMLTDGSNIEAMLIGDEHGHWYVDRNGKALRMNEDGKAEYITTTQLNELKSARNARVNKSNARRMANINITREIAAEAKAAESKKYEFGKPTTIIGKKRGLVILVNFSDKSLQKKNTQELFNRRFNEEGYSDNGYIGSVHDYFYDQSYGKFNVTFDIVGPVTVSKKHNYYGENDKYGEDKHAAEMVIEAINLVHEQGVDFSQYDWTGDGKVDQVFVMYAGTGENAGYDAYDIWPHEYTLDEANESGDGTGSFTLDGVKINTYAVSSELADSKNIDGIGCACHEFSHCLGYADLYDTDYSGGWGMECWDLLDGGSYNGPNNCGEIPAAFTSFERIWAGWMDPVVLDTPQSITDMPAINDDGVAYKIVNDAHPDEYFLVENRQAKRWDSYTAGPGNSLGHGMLILHVDYDEETWKNNTPNDNPNRQRMTFIPADENYGYKSGSPGYFIWEKSYSEAQGDPFPGTKNITTFNDSTKNAKLYNANTDGSYYMHKPITNITESTDGLISFDFTIIDPTSIEEIITSPASNSCHTSSITYNLAGQTVDDNYKGIVIQNGNKVLRR